MTRPIIGQDPWGEDLNADLTQIEDKAEAAQTDIDTHEVAADPHAQYLREALLDPETAALVTDTGSDLYAAIIALLGGGASLDVFKPVTYGAVGDATGGGTGTDDTAALQAMFDAMGAAGGGICHWWGGTSGDNAMGYRITSDLDIPSGCAVLCAPGTVFAGDEIGTRVYIDGAGTAVNFGTWAGGESRPGLLFGLTVDGDGEGDPTGILRVQAQETMLINVHVRNADGDGACFDHTQNSQVDNLTVADCGGTGITCIEGCGGLNFNGGHVYSCQRMVWLDFDSGASAGHQFPYAVKFSGMIMETYVAGLTDNIVEIDAAWQVTFEQCVFSANVDNMNDGALVVINTGGASVPEVEFDRCWFNGYSGGGDLGIDVTGTSPVIVQMAGRHIFLNCDSPMRTATAQGVYNWETDPRQTPVIHNLLSVTGAGDISDVTISKAPLVTRYLTAQTDTAYTIPVGAKRLRLWGVGGGGGGGGGSRHPAGQVCFGGGGGGGAGFFLFDLDLTDIIAAYSTLYVTVGAAGTGGAGATADGTNGSNGVAGGSSYVAVAASPAIGDLIASALGGGAGLGGTTAAGTGGAQGLGGAVGGNGGSGGAAGGAGATPTVFGQNRAGQGGGAGGGITAANAQSAGGAGLPPIGWWNTTTATGGTAGGGAGTAGTGAAFLPPRTASGGGGGGSNTGGAGGAGGVGGKGSGGGGGGAARNGANGGAGADGGVGFVVIVAEF